jgi:hypothetical protein
MKFAVKDIDGVQLTDKGKLSKYYTVRDDYNFSGNSATDVTDMYNFELFIDRGRLDYKHIRDYSKDVTAVTPFSAQTFDMQTKVAIYRGIDDASLIGFYMGQGMSFQDAKIRVLTEYIQHAAKFTTACEMRWNAAKYITINYLTFTDAIHFVRSTRDLVEDMLKYGILGTGDGDEDDGLLNYIDSTGEWANMGLEFQNYTTPVGTTINDLVTELVDSFRYGYYDNDKIYLPHNG